MEILNKLKEQGWYLTEEGLKKIIDAETPGTDAKKIIASALNWDFREIAGGALPVKREETLPGRIVLQVLKIRNIAAPKANEESKVAPRFLQIDFSDGQTLLQGLELEPIPALSLNVAPGTKVYLRAERLQLMQGFAVLKAADVQVLGGRVEQLAEKWELARTMMKYARSGRRISGSSGPPPWIAFGKKLEVKDSLDARNFKSLQSTDKDKDASKENEEFKAMRTEAIAEAAKAGSKKVFGGGNQQIIDHNVKKILEKGYNEEDAKQALRSTNNNLERALYNLKRRDDYKRHEDKSRNSVESAPATGRFGRGGATSRDFGGKRGAASAKEEASAAKPAANVSLFDFLTEKLPANAETTNRTEGVTTTAALSSSNNNTSNSKFEKSKSDVAKSSHPSKTQPDSSSSSLRPKFENNLSSSFAANRTPGAPRSGGRSEREPYNASERQSSARYSSASGRGGGDRGRGGRGGSFQSGTRSSFEDGNNRGGYQQRRETGGGGGTERNVNSNNNNSANNRNNRSSHERSTAATTQIGNDKNQTQSTGSNENRRQPQDYQNKGHDKSRYNQKEHSNNSGSNNRQYENNSNRRESSYTAANNNSSKAAVPAASNANNNNQNNSNTSEHAARMNKLVESTSKMKIDKTRDTGRNQQRQQNQRQQQQQQQQQQQHQQQQHQQQQQQYSTQQQQAQQMSAVQQYSGTAPHQLHQQMLLNNQVQPNYGQHLPNGFSYDPSKIIGFQSKETNEFAMTLLKSQGLAAPAAPQQTPSTATHYMPPSAAPLQMPQQQQQPFAKPAAFVLPTVQSTAPPSHASNYGMMQPADCWMWKIGDICLAKYWDDGRYYEAEITGVSEKTCVVFFRGYGNHEEVLQSDCLPITDANHRPINHYNNPNQQQQQQQLLAAALQQQQSHPPPPNMHLNNSAQSRAVPNRYRGERQVYVPPPKRDN